MYRGRGCGPVRCGGGLVGGWGGLGSGLLDGSVVVCGGEGFAGRRSSAGGCGSFACDGGTGLARWWAGLGALCYGCGHFGGVIVL